MVKRVLVSVGDMFGRLKIVSELPSRARNGGGRERWFHCECECGKTTDVPLNRMRRGHTRSCGCLIVPPSPSSRKPFVGVKVKKTKEYSVYKGIKARCYKPSSKGYPRYGGRGIMMCSRWKSSFKAFLADMGVRPSDNHQIDRKDNDGHYSCGHCLECVQNKWVKNCRWVDRATQRRNQSDVIMLTFRGETLCMSDMAKRYGMTKGTLRERLSRMSLSDALMTPVRSFRRDAKFMQVPEPLRDHEWKRDKARRERRSRK